MGKGFTLVELAIVLVIIDLLVGGVLAGQELIHISKRSAAVRQVNEYVTSIAAYQTKYNQLPGDDKRAANFLSGATSGNGDSYVYSDNASTPLPSGDCITSGLKSVAGSPTELTSFWEHLSLAGLIKFSPTNGTLSLKDVLPEYGLVSQSYVVATCIMTADNWGVSGLYSPTIASVLGSGHVFVLGVGGSQNGTGSRIKYLMSTPGGLPIVDRAPPEDNYYVDQKLDDGIPNKGIVKVSIGCDYNHNTYTLNDPTCGSTLSYKWGKI